MEFFEVKIGVVGIGGAGNNFVTRLMEMGIKSAETIAINTDAQQLRVSKAHSKFLLGKRVTNGMGAGGNPEKGKIAAEQDAREIERLLEKYDLVFLLAGMGGGTGTGATPVIASLLKEMGKLVVSFVTFPFSHERRRQTIARNGIHELLTSANTVVVIDNQRLVDLYSNLSFLEAFKKVDDVILEAIKGIADTIVFPSMMNIDYADLKATMDRGGLAFISVGTGKGRMKVDECVEKVLHNPLLDVEYSDVKGALIHIEGHPSLTLGDAITIGNKISESFPDEAMVKLGARVNPGFPTDFVKATLVASGVKSSYVMG